MCHSTRSVFLARMPETHLWRFSSFCGVSHSVHGGAFPGESHTRVARSFSTNWSIALPKSSKSRPLSIAEVTDDSMALCTMKMILRSGVRVRNPSCGWIWILRLPGRRIPPTKMRQKQNPVAWRCSVPKDAADCEQPTRHDGDAKAGNQRQADCDDADVGSGNGWDDGPTAFLFWLLAG